MGGSTVQFQTPTALYQALAGTGDNATGGGLFGATPFPWLGEQQGGASGSPYLSALYGIQSLDRNTLYTPNNTNPDAGTIQYANALAQSGNGLLGSAGNALQSGYNTFNQVSPYISQALTQGFDPQNALYNKLFQQQQDQANAENAMAGVATTPYGAGLVNQGNQNFNLAWQQQQLANQAQAAGTASQLANAGMGALSSGAGTAGNLLGSAAAAEQAPQNLIQQQIQDYLAYISANTANSAAMTGATNAATNAGAASTNALANAQAAGNSGKGGIGGALGGIGSLVGKVASGGKG